MYDYLVQPYLHYSSDGIYNPLEDKTLFAGQPGFVELSEARNQPGFRVEDIEIQRVLVEDGWLVRDVEAESKRFFLKFVSLEAQSVCNHACHFCPVSVAPRERQSMSSELYSSIVEQLSAYKESIQAIFMNQYNEPSLDKRFLWQVATLKKHGLTPAVLSNASGLTPKRVDALIQGGGVGYLSINFSTLDRQEYFQTRGVDQLPLVLSNLDYLKNLPLAPRMEMNVLGDGDARHQHNFQIISDYFANSNFEVKYFRYMDRSSYLESGLKLIEPHARLRGCEQTGSRLLQHLHITASGTCVLCCQDYNERHVVGDLKVETVAEVLAGEKLAQARKWAYGVEEAPADYLCRKCVFAIAE